MNELNPNLLPSFSYFPSSTAPAFYGTSGFDGRLVFGSAAVANASVPIAAAAAVDSTRGDKRSVQKGTRKGRHSKICTAKGPRDRRMRLSIDVARNFFRLQDMLGFDKASKTVQWLLTMSKASIKELAFVSSPKSSTSLGNDQSLRSTESSTTFPRDGATGSRKAIKSSSKTKPKKEPIKPAKKTEFHSAQAKELRAKARQRARERTRVKQRMLSSSFPIAMDPTRADVSSFDLKTLLEFADREVEGDLCVPPNHSSEEGPSNGSPIFGNGPATMAEINFASYIFEEQWEMEALSLYSRS